MARGLGVLRCAHLSNDLKEAMQMMVKIDQIEQEFPGLDCGACGAPPAGRC